MGPVRVEPPVGAFAGNGAGCWVVPVVVVVVVVTVVVPVGHSDQPQLPALLELSVFMSDVARLLLRSLPGGRRWTAAAVLEAQLRLRAPFFGEVESLRSGLERGQTEVSGADLRRLDAHTFSTVDGAGGEDGWDDGSETLSGSGGGNGLWAGVGDVHPSDRVTPKVVRLHLFFSLSLSMYSTKVQEVNIHLCVPVF